MRCNTGVHRGRGEGQPGVPGQQAVQLHAQGCPHRHWGCCLGCSGCRYAHTHTHTHTHTHMSVTMASLVCCNCCPSCCCCLVCPCCSYTRAPACIDTHTHTHRLHAWLLKLGLLPCVQPRQRSPCRAPLLCMLLWNRGRSWPTGPIATAVQAAATRPAL